MLNYYLRVDVFPSDLIVDLIFFFAACRMTEVGEEDDSLAAEFLEGEIGLWKELNPCNWKWGDPLA